MARTYSFKTAKFSKKNPKTALKKLCVRSKMNDEQLNLSIWLIRRERI